MCAVSVAQQQAHNGIDWPRQVTPIPPVYIKKMTSMNVSPKQSKFGTVLRVTSGNFMEMFDFFLFGFYATYIAKTFFPAADEFASLMFTFMTFGAGFLMRPLGAIFLGAYVDRVGRRQGLIVTLIGFEV